MTGTGDSQASLAVVKLPAPVQAAGPSIWQTMLARRSLRRYLPEPLALADLSQLLWATQGTTAVGRVAFRSVPSAGALYPVDTYLLVNRVSGLEPGLYSYLSAEHALKRMMSALSPAELAAACYGQTVVLQASAVFIWVAVPSRLEARYRERAIRYIDQEAGHIAQNLYLGAAALGLGCCVVGAFVDETVERLLGLETGLETVRYMGCVGPVA